LIEILTGYFDITGKIISEVIRYPRSIDVTGSSKANIMNLIIFFRRRFLNFSTLVTLM
jgi:hypothetical protein